MAITDIERQIRMLSLRVGIERYLTTRNRYMTELRNNFRHMPVEEFESVVAEMTREGLLSQSPGRNGAVIVTVNNDVQNKEEADGN
jgi:hypothetical protein